MDFVALLANPKVMAALLALLGTLAGYIVKRWMKADDTSRVREETRAQEAKAESDFSSAAADQTASVNTSIDKQDEAAAKFSREP